MVSIGFASNAPSPTSPVCASQQTGGLLEVNGTISLISHNHISSASFKNNITDISDPLETIKRLRGVTFQWKPSHITDSTLTGDHFGFIAEQVDTVIPNIVHQGEGNIKTVSQDEILPILVEAVKLQETTIDSLSNQLNTLQSQVNNCCNQNMYNGGESNNDKEGESSKTESPGDDVDRSKLHQNQPNPFSQNTTIRYYLTDHVQQARLMIFDMQGRLIRTYEVEQTGWNEQVIQGGTLRAGMYYYTLTANGQEVSTRKMILTK